MQKNILRVAVNLGLALAIGGAVLAQSAKPKPAGGIKVHGHWIIVVRNPDGSVAARREFENSLVDTYDLVDILGGISTPGGLSVQLANSDSSTGPCAASVDLGTTSIPCSIVPPAPSSGGQSLCQLIEATCSANLVVSTLFIPSGTSGSVFALQLQGSVQIPKTGGGVIDYVASLLNTCSEFFSTQPRPASTQSPATCQITSAQTGSQAVVVGQNQFTRTGITPVNVIPYQTVEVTVQISFS